MFTSSDVYKREDFCERHIRGLLIELCHAGLIQIEAEGGRGKAYKYRIARVLPSNGNALEGAAISKIAVLPTENEVFEN